MWVHIHYVTILSFTNGAVNITKTESWEEKKTGKKYWSSAANNLVAFVCLLYSYFNNIDNVFEWKLIAESNIFHITD